MRISRNNITLFASLPAHYERDQRWLIKGYSVAADRYTLLSPNLLTVNIDDGGYVLDSQVEIDLSQAANWDATTPTDYTVAANRAGKDFYIYACQQAGITPKLVLSANSTMPFGYTADNSRKIGGFHCLCVAVGTISGHTLTDFAAGDILPESIWDLKHRPKVASPEGMVYSEKSNLWVDIYLASGTGSSTASAYGATISDSRNWMDFVDDGAAVKKRMLRDMEFQVIAAGSNEETNISGSVDPVTTGGHSDTAGRRMISDIGCEDCCGVLWQWLDEQSFRVEGNHSHTENQEALYTQSVQTAQTDIAGWSWYNLPGSKGSFYRQGNYGDVKLLAGAYWSCGSNSGSRARYAIYYRWSTDTIIGCRFAAEPI